MSDYTTCPTCRGHGVVPLERAKAEEAERDRRFAAMHGPRPALPEASPGGFVNVRVTTPDAAQAEARQTADDGELVDILRAASAGGHVAVKAAPQLIRQRRPLLSLAAAERLARDLESRGVIKRGKLGRLNVYVLPSA